MRQLLLYCRPGFERECAGELLERSAQLGYPGAVSAAPASGYVVFTPNDGAPALWQALCWRSLIFARQLLITSGLLADLPAGDRIGPLLAVLSGLADEFSDVWLETADSAAAKPLARFCRSVAPPLRQALRRAGLLKDPADDDDSALRLHLFFLSASAVYPALAQPANASPWPMGIPRLKLPHAAPSRSALKLEEALLYFLGHDQLALRLQPGMRAVDLGAAPGGWSWLLARRGLRVTAVDNGPLAKQLLESGLVEQRHEDGFRYRPPRPVDWLVCDIADRPGRVARLVASWVARGDCRECIFNLKLPMKERYREVLRCCEIIRQVLGEKRYRLALKQLYHDRAEVTGHLARE